jgi:hypothetical protein
MLDVSGTRPQFSKLPLVLGLASHSGGSALGNNRNQSDHIRELLARRLEIMETGRDLELAVDQVVAMGNTIIANQNDLGALHRYAERLERQDLARDLDHPMGWQDMDMGQLRAMMQNRYARIPTRECRGRHGGGYPKPGPPTAPGSTSPGTTMGTATGTHSTQNYQQNQALCNQQALDNQAQDQEQSDQSAVTWDENQDHPSDQIDWEGNTY